MKVVRSSASCTARLYPQGCSWYSFSLGAESTTGPWNGRKEMSLKIPVTPPGIDPGTVWLVAQRLNHYATPGPCNLVLHRHKWRAPRLSKLLRRSVAGLTRERVQRDFLNSSISIWKITLHVGWAPPFQIIWCIVSFILNRHLVMNQMFWNPSSTLTQNKMGYNFSTVQLRIGEWTCPVASWSSTLCPSSRNTYYTPVNLLSRD